jgi:hypothetical protein
MRASGYRATNQLPMKKSFAGLHLGMCLTLTVGLFAGCDRHEPKVIGRPVTSVQEPPPAKTPFEQGSAQGFSQGEAAAKQNHPLPSHEDLLALAHQAAPPAAAGRGKWEEGFASGFAAGHRKVSEKAL